MPLQWEGITTTTFIWSKLGNQENKLKEKETERLLLLAWTTSRPKSSCLCTVKRYFIAADMQARGLDIFGSPEKFKRIERQQGRNSDCSACGCKKGYLGQDSPACSPINLKPM